jgi:hypothetical protein
MSLQASKNLVFNLGQSMAGRGLKTLALGFNLGREGLTASSPQESPGWLLDPSVQGYESVSQAII